MVLIAGYYVTEFERRSGGMRSGHDPGSFNLLMRYSKDVDFSSRLCDANPKYPRENAAV